MSVYPDQPLPPSPFTRVDAETHGIARSALRAMIRDGRVVRVLRGVYATPGYDDSLEFRAQAAKLAVNPNAVLCDRTAAWLHGVDVLTQPDKDVIPPLDTCTLRGTTGSQRPECRRRQRDLRPDDVMQLHGLRVTTPVRTAADLGCCLSRRSALAALDGFMRVCRLSRTDLEAQLPFYFRRRGVVQLRELVGIATPKAESPPESWMRLEVIDAGLPSPSPQWWITIDGVPTFRLDLAYPMLKIVIEYDGREFHSSKADRRRDKKRRKWLTRHGWIVIVIDKDSFTREAVAAWTGEIRAAIQERVDSAHRVSHWRRSGPSRRRITS